MIYSTRFCWENDWELLEPIFRYIDFMKIIAENHFYAGKTIGTCLNQSLGTLIL